MDERNVLMTNRRFCKEKSTPGGIAGTGPGLLHGLHQQKEYRQTRARMQIRPRDAPCLRATVYRRLLSRELGVWITRI